MNCIARIHIIQIIQNRKFLINLVFSAIWFVRGSCQRCGPRATLFQRLGEHRSQSSNSISRIKSMSSLKAYKYRLYPNKKQEEKLQWTLDRARELYNAALQERRDAYEMMVKRHPNYYDKATRKLLIQEHAITYNRQATHLPEIKAIRPEYQDIHSQVLQDVLRRVDKAYKAFFRRV